MKPSTPEGRLRQKIVLTTKTAGRDDAWMYDLASQVVGRKLSKGWGLSTCSVPELVQILDRVVLATGGTPLPHRRGAHRGLIARLSGRDGLIRLATASQKDLIVFLAREIFGATAVGSPFATFLERLTGRTEIRLLTTDKASKTIEALIAMQKRKWRPRGEEQQAAGSRQQAANSDGPAWEGDPV
jgi:hypothetical protein